MQTLHLEQVTITTCDISIPLKCHGHVIGACNIDLYVNVCGSTQCYGCVVKDNVALYGGSCLIIIIII